MKIKKILLPALVLLMLLPKLKAGESNYRIQNGALPAVLQKKNFKPSVEWKQITVIATAYDNCKHCTLNGKGITASGMRASRGMIAAPRNLPFGTVIKLDGLGEFVVQDRGGAIKIKNGIYYIDVWMPTHKEAVKFGRKKLKGWIKVN